MNEAKKGHGGAELGAVRRINDKYFLDGKTPSTSAFDSADDAFRKVERSCSETLGMFFGSIFPQIWISARVCSSSQNDQVKMWQIRVVSFKMEGMGFWFIPNLATFSPKSFSDFSVILIAPGNEENQGKTPVGPLGGPLSLSMPRSGRVSLTAPLRGGPAAVAPRPLPGVWST